MNGNFSKKNEDKKMRMNEYEFEMAGLNKQITKIQVDSRPQLK